MEIADSTLEILTLGSFSISVAGDPVAENWPDEAVKAIFCSLLSPLDLYFSWDRICRAMLGLPETLANRSRLEETHIRPLKIFLIRELGFNPLITDNELIKLDMQRFRCDACEFHNAAVEGLRLLSLGNKSAATERFSRADTLYGGSYLPGMTGKIIINTRRELDALHRSVLKESAWLAGGGSCRLSKAVPASRIRAQSENTAGLRRKD